MALLDPEKKPTLADVEPYDPDAPVVPDSGLDASSYQVGGLLSDEPAPTYGAPDAYTPSEEATVKGQMGGLLDSGSKYIQTARERGRREAQSRGLLNSSIAAGTAEKAAIESALPIALQDARSFQEAGMAGYLGEIEGARATQTHESETQLVGTKADASAKLAAQEGAIKSGLSAQDARQRAYQTQYEASVAAGLSKQEAEQQAALAADKAERDYTYQSQLQTEGAGQAQTLEGIRQAGADVRQDREIAAQQALANLDISSSEKKTATDQIRMLGDSYAEQVEMIQRDPNVSAAAKQTVIRQLTDIYETNMQLVTQMYGITLSWGTEGEEGEEGEGVLNPAPMPAPPGTTTPPVNPTPMPPGTYHP